MKKAATFAEGTLFKTNLRSGIKNIFTVFELVENFMTSQCSINPLELLKYQVQVSRLSVTKVLYERSR